MSSKTKAQILKYPIFAGGVIFSFCLLSSVFCLQSAWADPQADFKQANDLYRSGKFSEAAKMYEGLVADASPSVKPVLFYNAANSYFRAGQTHLAIWNYERTLFLSPWHADAQYNLNVLRSKSEYKIEDRRNLFIRFYDLALKWIKTTQFACLTLICLFIFLVSLGFWLRNPNRQHFWAFPRGEFFVIGLLFATCLCAKVFYNHHYIDAIVLASEAEVRYGPSMDNQSLMKLGGGLKVFIVDAREDWSRVVTWNGETGWIKNSELGRVDA